MYICSSILLYLYFRPLRVVFYLSPAFPPRSRGDSWCRAQTSGPSSSPPATTASKSPSHGDPAYFSRILDPAEKKKFGSSFSHYLWDWFDFIQRLFTTTKKWGGWLLFEYLQTFFCRIRIHNFFPTTPR